MRRLFVLFALIGLVQLNAGCKHTAGGCDCGQSPGESFPVNSVSHKPYTPNGMPVPVQTIEPINAPKVIPQ